MTYFTYHGTISTPASTGTVNYTLSFQPQAIIFWSDAFTASGDTGNLAHSIGWWATSGGTPVAILDASANNVSSIANGAAVAANAVNLSPSLVGTPAVQANVSATSSTGFTLNYTLTAAGYLVHYLALGGTDLTNAFCGTFNSPAANGTGATAYTGIGFRPDFLLLGAPNPLASGWLYGAATSSTARWSFAGAAVTSGTMAAANFASHAIDNGKVLGLIASGGAASYTAQADFVSMDAGGFTLNWTLNGTSQFPWYFLALQGGTYSVGTFAKNANTSDTQLAVNAGLPIAPSAYLLATTATTAIATIQTDNMRLGFGAVDAVGNDDSIATESAVSVLPTQTRKYSDAGTGNAGTHNVCTVRAAPPSVSAPGATEVAYSHGVYANNGMTLNYATNGTTNQYIFGYATFGPVFTSSASGTVGTTTNQWALGFTGSRQIAYSTISGSGLWYVVWYDGSSLGHATSANGTTWSSKTTFNGGGVGPAGTQVSGGTLDVDSAGKLYLAWGYDNTAGAYCYQVFNGTSWFTTALHPGGGGNFCLCSGCLYEGGGHIYSWFINQGTMQVAVDVTSSSTFTSEVGVQGVVTWGTVSSMPADLLVTGGTPNILTAGMDNSSPHRLYNTSSLATYTGSQLFPNATVFETDANFTGEVAHCVDTAAPTYHVVYRRSGTGWFHGWNRPNIGWQTGQQISMMTDNDRYPALCYDGIVVHLFWCRFNATNDYGIGHAILSTFGTTAASSVFVAQPDVVTDNGVNRTYLNAARNAGGGNIGLTWMEGTASPWNIVATLVPVPPATYVAPVPFPGVFNLDAG